MVRKRRENRTTNWVRHKWFAGLGMLGLLMLFSQQNCAPVGAQSASASAAAKGATADSPVTVIDDPRATSGLSFDYKEVQLAPSTLDTPVVGNCSKAQDGAVLGWKISTVNSDGSTGSEIAQGFADCSDGNFKVEISKDLDCGKKFQLVAQLGFGTPGVIVVSRTCASN